MASKYPRIPTRSTALTKTFIDHFTYSNFNLPRCTDLELEEISDQSPILIDWDIALETKSSVSGYSEMFLLKNENRKINICSSSTLIPQE